MTGTGVITQYLGPTDAKGSRVKASFTDHPGTSITAPYDHSLTGFQMHRMAAILLLRKYELYADDYNETSGGSLNGYIFIFTEKANGFSEPDFPDKVPG